MSGRALQAELCRTRGRPTSAELCLVPTRRNASARPPAAGRALQAELPSAEEEDRLLDELRAQLALDPPPLPGLPDRAPERDPQLLALLAEWQKFFALYAGV